MAYTERKMVAFIALVLSASHFVYTTKSGATLRLASVSNDYAMRSWSPDGAPHAKWLSNAMVMEDRHSSMNPDYLNGKLSLLILVEHAAGKHWSYGFDGSGIKVTESGAIPADFGYVMTGVHNAPQIRASFKRPSDTQPVDVVLTFSDRPWRSEGEYLKATKRLTGNLSIPSLSVMNNASNYKWVQVTARAKKVEPNRLYELLLLDAKGKPFESQAPVSRPQDPGRLEVAYRLLGKPLGRVVLRSRPMERFVFHGVHLSPNG